MALSNDDLGKLEALLGSAEADAAALTTLRQQLPGLSLTRCDASDMDCEQPFREYPKFSLYLVDGTDHCWRLTTDPARATGLVVVQHKAAA
ncbi:MULTISPECIES: hypothetical protein [Rhodopseudomonas]|uniref:Uncharacterized protein n=1 Tax=Rhodopseudomonas palustris TaxID=1076 RepID=A0A0D7E1I3_RHOPL|nr:MULTISPECIES: hypothetical protein [Rhodopseudomonas]KIZ34678.1 hypothetical protein OO17_26470 [Rhodopseudomonas palustris]MDF3810972.1 hypothetical protein [Rhodopseudomonas sp. BAL398]WOK15874.1 hypothetical protein RBJ75_17040 [Rhodopseudomonas sp. BAL398]